MTRALFLAALLAVLAWPTPAEAPPYSAIDGLLDAWDWAEERDP